MKQLCVLSAAIMLIAVGFHISSTHASAKTDKYLRSSRPVPNQYLVVLNDDFTSFYGGAENAVAALNQEFPGAIRHEFSSALNGYSVEMDAEQAKQLSQDPRVKYVEEDGYVSESSVEYNPGWGLDRIDQHLLPFDTTYNYSGSGTGVNIYIIDSGILTTHVEFQGRAFDDYDAVHDNTPISQCNGHGTGVAGIAGSFSYGPGKNVSLHSVRVLPCTGYGTVSDVISGVDWVTKHGVKPAVANMSLETNYSKSMNDSVSASINAGITYVVAAGNDTADACYYSPSSVPGAITVGSTNTVDERVSYSNFGSCVDIFAPGEGVTTVWNTSDTIITYMSGTSAAAPYVAGVAALYLEKNPSASPQQVQSALTAGATSGALSGVGTGSPNLLLYTMWDATPVTQCDGTAFNGDLPSPGYIDYQSSASGFSGVGGKYYAKIQMPAGASFTLSLEKKGGFKWSTVATSSNGSSVTYTGKSGTYRWKVADVSGSGTYSLCTLTP